MLSLCRERGLTLATAESCTGGLVAARLTSVPGSSDVFLGGVVSYANEVKASALGVPGGGAASSTARCPRRRRRRWRRGARERLGADLAVSVTGIAGPGGGSAEKPVGLVYLHACGPGRASARPTSSRPATARRCARGRPSPRCTSCANLSQSCDRHVTGSVASVGGSESLRLFCALRLPDDVVDDARRLAAARAARPPYAAARERIVPPSNLHVTLAFLGSRPAGELPAIGAALRTAAAERRRAAAPAARLPRDAQRRDAHLRRRGRTRRGGRRAAARAPRGARASTSARSGRGSRTSPCSGSASAPRPPAAAAGPGTSSFRPTRLFTSHGCVPAGRSTKSWNRSS